MLEAINVLKGVGLVLACIPVPCYLITLSGTWFRRGPVTEFALVKRVGAGLDFAYALTGAVSTPFLAASLSLSWVVTTHCYKDPSQASKGSQRPISGYPSVVPILGNYIIGIPNRGLTRDT